MTVSLQFNLDYFERTIWRICECTAYVLNRDHTNGGVGGVITGKKYYSTLTQHPMEKGESSVQSHLISFPSNLKIGRVLKD